MLDEVTGLRQLMTLWADLKSHMLASYRTCFVNILKVCSPPRLPAQAVVINIDFYNYSKLMRC